MGFLDISNAFDVVNCGLLLAKIEALAITPRFADCYRRSWDTIL